MTLLFLVGRAKEHVDELKVMCNNNIVIKQSDTGFSNDLVKFFETEKFKNLRLKN